MTKVKWSDAVKAYNKGRVKKEGESERPQG